MDEFRKQFWDTFEQMQEDFDRFFDHYAHAKQPTLLAYRTHWSPPCNVYDASDSLRVLVEIAGMCRENLDLRVEDDRLILHGNREVPDAYAQGNYLQMEIEFGDFELQVHLPSPVDAEAVHAWYREGFLHVVLPKIPESKPIRVKLTVPEYE
ncbi:MAG: Hsp20/alpha crystallin family protein [Armatimonadota bacterium]